MPCYHPLTALDLGVRKDTGKKYIKVLKGTEVSDWARKQANVIPLPCGRCIGCRLERSRQWAVRCVHEASLYPQNSFITLTFREACPLDGTKTDPTESLHKHHFQRFMKRLRKHFFGNSKGTIRYFHCGEYGEKMGRPHHHACLFNIDFPDKKLWSVRDGVRLYRSKILESLWPFGSSTVGDVTFDSAAYVARYVVKKITGDPAAAHYGKRLPEYCTMSRRPGLSREWLNKYSSDLYPKDFVVIRGKRMKIPKYYDKRFELTNPDEYETIRELRKQNAKENPDNCQARLHAGEVIQKQKAETLNRGYEKKGE